MTMTTAAAATVCHELCVLGWAVGVSRPGTKYPVRGIPHFDLRADATMACTIYSGATTRPQCSATINTEDVPRINVPYQQSILPSR